ncbi:MAG: NmrA/HSCARG family protein [Phycisphaerales bacterium]|nr:NmrA/HSCARG family protein [Hyphomonadaceae bacterium]
MTIDTKKLIAVLGASENQGGGVVSALKVRGEFRVRALTRNPEKYRGVADEVVAADLTRPETLKAAFDGAYGVFAVTNFWEPGGIDEIAQGEAAVRAAKAAGVEHFVWSTLPNVEDISGDKYHVPHFTSKAKVDAIVAAAGFSHHSFVIAPGFYQSFLGNSAPQPQQDGSIGWTLPIDGDARVVHSGDISELGKIVAGAFAHPEIAGNGQYLPLVGELLSYHDIVATLNKQGHAYTFHSAPREVFAAFFPGAGELAEMFAYFEEYTYLGTPSEERIALANKVAGSRPTDFATWARTNMPVNSHQVAPMALQQRSYFNQHGESQWLKKGTGSQTAMLQTWMH